MNMFIFISILKLSRAPKAEDSLSLAPSPRHLPVLSWNNMRYSELHFPPRNCSRGHTPLLPLLGAFGATLSQRALVGMNPSTSSREHPGRQG